MSVREIVNKYASLLKEDKYEEVFSKCSSDERIELLHFLYNQCGIDVLPFLTEIPNSFFMHTNIKNITIPNNITHIGSQAFADSGITQLYIDNSVVFIGASAFSNSMLAKIRLSTSIDTIQRSTFRDCKNLHQIYIPESVTRIDRNAFTGCPDDLLIVTEFRDTEDSKIKFPTSEIDFYKKHLKFRRK